MKRFRNILLYTGTEKNEGAVSRAFELAIENDAALTIMDVVKPLARKFRFMTGIDDPEGVERLIMEDHRQQLLSRAKEYADTAVRVNVVVAAGDPAMEITRQVMLGKHDLVIKTADGSSFTGQLFGSVARSLMRVCPCPVWLLKPETHGPFDCVVAAIDVESHDEDHQGLNRDILELAQSMAERENAQLHVVGAWELWMEQSLRRRAGDAQVDAALAIREVQMRQMIDELLPVPKDPAARLQVHLIRGTPANVIRDVVSEFEADLLVMGTVCRTKAAGFLIGNTAETVVSGIDCSLLAVKPKGFVSPISGSDTICDDDARHHPTGA